MEYDFNGISINLKDQVCTLEGCIPGKIYPQANLYVRVENRCNANCKFCEYHGEYREFNLEYFKIISDLNKRGIVGKIQITGGEPTINNKLNDIVKIIREYFPDRFVGINTNGYNLGILEKLKDDVDNFAISRHHFDDNINQCIFGTNSIPSNLDIKDFIDKVGSDKVHITCNLMKDYINDEQAISEFLEKLTSVTGCNDFGLVTLMPINVYSKDQKVEFNKTGIDESNDYLRYRQYTKGDCCRCANYMYYCNSCNAISKLYGRFVMKNKDTTGILVYDLDTLKSGFNGPVIHVGDNK